VSSPGPLQTSTIAVADGGPVKLGKRNADGET
jgi:hypothetical protein